MTVKLTHPKRQTKQTTANSEVHVKATVNKNKKKAVKQKKKNIVSLQVRVRICLLETSKAPVFRPNPIHRRRKATRIQETGVRRKESAKSKTYKVSTLKKSPNIKAKKQQEDQL